MRTHPCTAAQPIGLCLVAALSCALTAALPAEASAPICVLPQFGPGSAVPPDH